MLVRSVQIQRAVVHVETRAGSKETNKVAAEVLKAKDKIGIPLM